MTMSSGTGLPGMGSTAGTVLMGAGMGLTGFGCGVLCVTELRLKASSTSAAQSNHSGLCCFIVFDVAWAVSNRVWSCTSLQVSSIPSCSPASISRCSTSPLLISSCFFTPLFSSFSPTAGFLLSHCSFIMMVLFGFVAVMVVVGSIFT
jgi:hypothetical protein